ncbi:MAG: OB-fold nucleic acid binding domain-containing protein [Candidatus Micrarchaeia archaeon]
MNISELKPQMGSVSLKAEIVDIESPREINKMGRALRVANATLKDETGTISLVLWNEAIDKVQVGNMVQIENGYVNTWQDKMQLTLGKFGKMNVV